VFSADPDAWYRAGPEAMGNEAFADYRRAIHDPATVHAMCEDYRAGLAIDRAHDEADRAAGRRVSCPTLLAWSIHDDLRGVRIDSGHHMAEDAPAELAAALREFLSRS